jgi:hypothetical protein
MRALEFHIYNLMHRNLADSDKAEAQRLLSNMYIDAIPHVRDAVGRRADGAPSLVYLIVAGLDLISRGMLPICDAHWPPDDSMGLVCIPRDDIVEAMDGHRQLCAHLNGAHVHSVMVAWAGFVGVGNGADGTTMT